NLRQSQLSQRLDSIQGKLVPDTKKPNTPPLANTKPITPPLAKNATQEEEPKNSDVTKAITSASTSSDDDSNVVVMTNQLITVMTIRLRNNDTNSVNKKSAQTDSTLASMSDVDNAKIHASYRVEFWKSPLNYKGYKM